MGAAVDAGAGGHCGRVQQEDSASATASAEHDAHDAVGFRQAGRDPDS